MAITTIKSTYSLDVETVRTLESLACRWNVSKSEVLRRAIRAAAGDENQRVKKKLEALDRWQASLKAQEVGEVLQDGIGQQLVGGGARGEIGMMLRLRHGATVPRCAREGDRRARGKSGLRRVVSDAAHRTRCGFARAAPGLWTLSGNRYTGTLASRTGDA